METGLFIFRRDYRIVDNSALNKLSKMCKNIYTIFIFTPEQVGTSNKYKSSKAVQFMIEGLQELSETIREAGGKLYTFYGMNVSVIKDILTTNKIDIVAVNCDYTPYSIQRDMSIIKLCEQHKVQFTFDHDYNLHYPDEILNGSRETYQKFTPYYDAAMKKHNNHSPAPKHKLNLTNSTLKHTSTELLLRDAMTKLTKYDDAVELKGGRTHAIKRLKEALKMQNHYQNTHNDLSKNTSQLSAYIKFGCVSVREVYNVMKANKAFTRQLIWRDFYSNILYSFPHVLQRSLKPSYDAIKWSTNKRYLDAWKNGQTGFPVVDAGMRQLNKTGYMHNRARLIVASFLVKTLLLNWREGERYFATKLVDYDVASNNGNWQWIMGGGADSQPYFRIFNPWLQSAEHDENGSYIKKWIPELEEVLAKDLHKWNETCIQYKSIQYPKPIVDFSEQKEKGLQLYKSKL